MVIPMYIVGYKFGPEHSEIHWLWNNRGRTYRGTFSTDKNNAKQFPDREKALEIIKGKVLGFAPDNYNYCPVIEDTQTGNRETIMTFE